MSDTVIKVENISKLYRLGEIGTGTLSHDINRWWHSVRGKEDPYLKIGGANDRTVKGDSDYAWALKNINFEVKRGEILGIIGRNGAGKSTLLKILSRVTTPTSGEIKVKGRIASLLEVGTGFHPELTGRENIYLNGAILGMRKHEIDRKFDEIVAFAEVERYIDTPVKRYSSGMYVRLAFAVAAHLEPEILIVDEVLAVGDVEFQKKCLGKMQDVATSEGRTVLFVSHNLSAIRSLCSSGVYLRNGRIMTYGGVSEVLHDYTENITQISRNSKLSFPYQGPKPSFTSLNLEKNKLACGDMIKIKGEVHSELSCQASVEIELHDERDIPVAYSSTAPMAKKVWNLKPGVIKFEIELGPIWLAEGNYRLFFWLIKPWVENYHVVEEPLSFEVVTSDPYASGFSFKQSYKRGSFAVPINSTMRMSTAIS